MNMQIEITRYNSDGDRISLLPEGKKKAKEFHISQLLEDIRQAVLRLIPKRKKKAKKKSDTPEKEQHPTPEL